MPIGTVLIESLLRLLLDMQASGSGRPGEVRRQGNEEVVHRLQYIDLCQ